MKVCHITVIIHIFLNSSYRFGLVCYYLLRRDMLPYHFFEPPCIKRFCKIIDKTGLKIHLPASGKYVSRKDDRFRIPVKRFRIGPYQLKGFYSVGFGHHMIQQDKVILFLLTFLNGFCTAHTCIRCYSCPL